jgi:hypothetical protein
VELTNEFEVAVPIDRAWAVLTDLERIAPCLPGAQLQEIEGDEYRGVVKVKVGPITAQYKGAARFVERDESAYRAVLQASGRDTRGQGNASATISAQLVAKEPSITQVEVLTDLSVTGKVAQFGRGVMADVSAKLMAQFVENLESRVLVGEDAGPKEAQVAEDNSSTDETSSQPAHQTPPDEADVVALVKAAQAAAGTGSAAKKPAKKSAKKVAKKAGTVPAKVEEAKVEEARVEEARVEEAKVEEAKVEEPATEHRDSLLRRVDAPEAEPIDLLETAGSPVLKRALPLLGLVAAALIVLRLVRRRRARG